MCRVNPNNIRQPSKFEDCWIVDPTHIRPYRILIKKIPLSSLTEDINTLILSDKPDINIVNYIKLNDHSFYDLANEERFKNFTCDNSPIDKNDYFAIRLYSGPFYRSINNFIREGNLSSLFNENHLKS